MGLVLFFYRLGVPGLMDPDEGRYAEIAREMLLLRDWLIPHLNLFPYLEKPPLVYWLTAFSFKLLGPSELAARLPSAAAALGGLLLAYGLGRVLWGPVPAFLGATVLATSAGYVALGRLLTLDMTFTLLLSLGIVLGYLAMRRSRPGLWPWAYGVLGLATLAKGPVALVLAGLIWGLWVLLISPPPQASPRKEEEVTSKSPLKLPGGARLRRPLLFQPWSWLLLLVLALPWFAWVTMRYPEFLRYFILEQHLGRFLTPAIHPEPFYYFGPVLVGLMFPWSFLLPWALWARARGDPDRLFLLIWAGVVLIFFSLSRGKLAPYILPALPPLALLLGRRLEGLGDRGPGGFGGAGFLASLWCWAAAGVMLFLLVSSSTLGFLWTRLNLSRPYLLTAAAVCTLTPALGLAGRRRALLFLGAGALILSALVPMGLEGLSQQRSFKEMGRLVKSHWQPEAALLGVDLYSQGLSFYSGEVFHLLKFRTELDFGSKLDPGLQRRLYLAGPGDLKEFAGRHPEVFLFMKAQHREGLAPALPGKVELLARQGDCLLMAYKGK